MGWDFSTDSDFQEQLDWMDELVRTEIWPLETLWRELGMGGLARAFGFEVKGLQGVSTVTEAGIKDRTELVSFIRGRGIRALFAESSVNAKGISAVAEEAGAKISGKTLFSDAMGKPGDLETVNGETYDLGVYTGMVKHNINAIVEGLK